MEVLARSGEPGAALAQYRDCVRTLDRELGVAPLSQTTGLAEEIRAGRLSDLPPAGPAISIEASVAVPSDVSAAVPLVGRAAEMAALVEAYRAAGPDGRLLFIEGEAGIGKTRLGSALADAIRSAGGTVLAARAYPGEAGIPFAPIVELVRAGLVRPGAAARLRTVGRDLLGEAARLVPLPSIPAAVAPGPTADPYGQARLLEALADVVAALAAGPIPGLIWLDDVGWADASTIELVGYIAHRLRGRPVTLLVTSRPEELTAGNRERILGAPDRDGLLVRVELGRLSRSDVAALAAAALGDAAKPGQIDSLFERSEGLPLYVTEALAAPVPTGDPSRAVSRRCCAPVSTRWGRWPTRSCRPRRSSVGRSTWGSSGRPVAGRTRRPSTVSRRQCAEASCGRSAHGPATTSATTSRTAGSATSPTSA
jgi:hypothetical protein